MSKHGRFVPATLFALVVCVIIALSTGAKGETPPSSATADRLRPGAWLPVQLQGRSPWCPTFTPTPTMTPTPTVTPTPTPRLKISGLEYKGSDEYVEIFNHGPGYQSLRGWKLHSVVGDQWFYFGEAHGLQAGTWLKVHSGPAAKDLPPQHLKWTSAYIWNDSGDEARLLDGLDNVVDRRAYGRR